MKLLVTCVIMEILASSEQLKTARKCFMPNNKCHCSRSNKWTRCSSLSFIPEIPDYTRTLELRNNKILHLNDSSFTNISSFGVRNLVLKNNSIQYIDNNAFHMFRDLKKLQISYEYNLDIINIKQSLQGLDVNILDELRLESNKLSYLPGDTFLHFKDTSLSKLSLSFNEFRTFNTTVFRPFAKLRNVYCIKCKIKMVVTKGLGYVNDLDLQSNDISSIPEFCNGNQSNSPKLRSLRLVDNAIRCLKPTSFRCLDSLQELILDKNRLATLENDVFLSLNNLQRLSVNEIPLSTIKPRAFHSISLKKIQFAYNDFRFDKHQRYDAKSIFRNTPSLRYLDLTSNYLSDDEDILRHMFCPLVNLTKLILQGTTLNIIPDRFLQCMSSLEILILKGNNIEKWSERAFQNVTSLKILMLDGNLLHTINETSFPINTLNALKTLDLSHNPFWCTCQLKWFLDLVRKTNLSDKLTNWPYRYTCSYPENLKRLWLKNYKPTTESCATNNPIFVITSISSTLVLAMFLTVIMILKCQINIRNAFYLFRLYRNRNFILSDSSSNYEYDAFIVYCDNDRRWVHEVLLKKLEGIGLKICVHQRDFDVGVPITNNIERYLNISWKVVVVMSNKFAKSEWCQWELCLVQERRRKKGRDGLVLIMYDQIDSKHMTSSLRTLLHTTPYITYRNGVGEKLFWKAVIRGVQKPYRVPPIALSFTKRLKGAEI